MARVNSSFLAEMKCSEEFNASACMHCGVCTAVCPVGYDLLPRRLFRYVLLGLEEKVIENTPTVFSCLLCKMCEENCPANVHIAENIRCLRCHINQNVFKLLKD
jgi:heterodisulfide reductase subunit C